MKTLRHLRFCTWMAFLAVSSLPALGGNNCPVNIPLSGLSPEDLDFVDEFGAARDHFREMSLEEFLAEYGPQKPYRQLGFIRGDATGDGEDILVHGVPFRECATYSNVSCI